MYIGGGNVFELLNFINTTGFDKVILHWANTNRTVIGSSAGTIVLGKDAKMYRKSKIDLMDYAGLNLCKDFSFVCHYVSNEKYKMYTTEEINKNILDYVKSSNNKVIAIPEDGALGFDSRNNKLFLLGGDLYICENSIIKKLYI